MLADIYLAETERSLLDSDPCTLNRRSLSLRCRRLTRKRLTLTSDLRSSALFNSAAIYRNSVRSPIANALTALAIRPRPKVHAAPKFAKLCVFANVPTVTFDLNSIESHFSFTLLDSNPNRIEAGDVDFKK